MTTESTTHPIALQVPALEVLADLAQRHPELPSPYVTLHRPWMGKAATVGLNLNTPTEFNQWMAVLGVQPEDVHMHPRGRETWLDATITQAGIQVTISTHGILLTADQTDAPRVLTEVAA